MLFPKFWSRRRGFAGPIIADAVPALFRSPWTMVRLAGRDEAIRRRAAGTAPMYRVPIAAGPFAMIRSAGATRPCRPMVPRTSSLLDVYCGGHGEEWWGASTDAISA